MLTVTFSHHQLIISIAAVFVNPRQVWLMVSKVVDQ